MVRCPVGLVNYSLDQRIHLDTIQCNFKSGKSYHIAGAAYSQCAFLEVTCSLIVVLSFFFRRKMCGHVNNGKSYMIINF